MAGYSSLIDRAIAFAARHHEGQYRKTPHARIPYVAHAFAVGMILQRADYPEEVVAAGILHDVVEDTAVTPEEIERTFNARVRAMVGAVSEKDKSLPWEERKARYIEHLRIAAPEVKAISCADKIHNLHSILTDLRRGIDIWSRFKRGRQKQIARYEKLREALRENWDHPLLDEYDEVLAMVVARGKRSDRSAGGNA